MAFLQHTNMRSPIIINKFYNYILLKISSIYNNVLQDYYIINTNKFCNYILYKMSSIYNNNIYRILQEYQDVLGPYL